ncbi:MAG: hypothetical protein FJ137_20785 [Deltaproteobacteria bacterium]|nr:hypothetical protein [Deltaproteobacteria bacterium]
MTSLHTDLETQAAPVVVQRLGKALTAIPAGPLRLTYLEERVADAPVAPLARMLACAQRESVRGEAHARVVVDTFTLLVDEQRLSRETHAALAATALALGEDAVLALVEQPAANDLPGNGAADRARKGSLADAGETLGRRKSLARTAQGDLLLKVLDDPDPQVISNAMMNPWVTEALAVRVAARRPCPGGVLDAVARSRFANNGAVRRALVLNPDCPQKLAQRLVSTMTPVDLYDVVHAQGVAKEVKAVARRLLDSR